MKIRKAGFTLMELLVVIAVIGLLAGMIFPMLGKAKIRARKTKAIAELKTIELALMDYYTEYSGFPTNKFKVPPTTNGINKLVEEGYLDTTLKDAFDSFYPYTYYSSDNYNGVAGGDGNLADSCIVFSVGPDRKDNGATDFGKAYTDAYPLGSTEPNSDNIYLILPVEDIRYQK